ncbi:MAG: hypothetical protein ABI338_00955 [Gemmatimonadaceae bacterium]
MTKKQNSTRYQAHSAPTTQKSPLDEARDELFQHIMRCGVIGAEQEHQQEWFEATIAYFAGRYSELTKLELSQLRTLGERFAQPLKTKQAV